jgi:hypothetical protein
VALGLILLVTAAVRVPVILYVPMWWDEIYTMWQVQAGFGQNIAMTPYDWPPLYFVVLWGWAAVAGYGDLSGRGLSLLFSLASVTLLYGAGRAIAGEWAGRLAALLFAVLPYAAYLSLEARGYSLLLLLASALAWIHVEWLRQPSGVRSGLYAAVAASCVYTSYTGILLVALVLTHAALATAWMARGVRGRHVARLATVLIAIAMLLLPIASWLAAIARLKWGHIAQGNIRPPGFDDLLTNYPRWVAGGQRVLLGALVALAAVGLVRWWRARAGPDTARLIVLLLAWAVAVPLGMHLLRHQLHLTSSRYLAYSIPGLVLALGTGLSGLPPSTRWLAGAAMLVYAVVPLPFELYRPPYPEEKPTREAVRAMGDRYRPGDVVLVDPACRCGRSVEWAYWESLYYPGGRMVRVAEAAQAGRRLWYVADERTASPTLAAMVAHGRIETASFGADYMRARLYEGPPDPVGLGVGAALRFHGHDFVTTGPFRPGDRLDVRLWWSAATTPTDHVFEVSVLGSSGEPVAIVAGSPEGSFAPSRTSRWEPGRLYMDQRTVVLPRRLGAGVYPFRLVTLRAEDRTVVPPESASRPPLRGAIVLGEVEVFTYN